MSPRDKAAVQEWSRKIEDFRHNLKLSQSDLAERLGTSAMAISRWERGVQKAPADLCIKLGNLAGDPLCWYFWSLAGLSTKDVMQVLPAAGRRLHGNRIAKVLVVHGGSRKKRPQAKNTDFVAIPLLPVHAGTPGIEGDAGVDLEQVLPESMWAAPSAWCPNPTSTVCFRVKGNSMSPLILDGYIIAVDTSEVVFDQLAGKIVVAHHEKKGLVVSRLTRFDHSHALVSDQREYETISMGHGSAWRIIGRVLWWSGLAR